ncbi:MAG TPA: protease inhibitor I42 family protein [Thermodesulfobacteriota bacterium]|nr:protease inhibitor I42 family protein [Thermodesulfobacteriota bacterium]
MKIRQCDMRWLLLFTAFSFAAIPGFGEAGETMSNAAVVLTKEDNGKEIAVKSGDMIEVQLEAMGGAGYWWYPQDLDAGHLELVSEKTRAASEGRVGGPVLGMWGFRARQPGVTAIHMAYYRTWEGSASAASRFSVRVKIE